MPALLNLYLAGAPSACKARQPIERKFVKRQNSRRAQFKRTPVSCNFINQIENCVELPDSILGLSFRNLLGIF